MSEVEDTVAPPFLRTDEGEAWANAAAVLLAALVATGRIGGATAEACAMADQIMVARRERLSVRPKAAGVPMPQGRWRL